MKHIEIVLLLAAWWWWCINMLIPMPYLFALLFEFNRCWFVWYCCYCLLWLDEPPPLAMPYALLLILSINDEFSMTMCMLLWLFRWARFVYVDVWTAVPMPYWYGIFAGSLFHNDEPIIDAAKTILLAWFCLLVNDVMMLVMVGAWMLKPCCICPTAICLFFTLELNQILFCLNIWG